MDTRRDTMTLPDYDIDTSFDTESFIEEVEARPAIWDSTCAEYSNRIHRNHSWNELVEKYGPKLSKIEKREFGELLKKKYKNLRACFTRELKRQGGLNDGRRKSEYVYFQKLKFLEPVVSPKDTEQSRDDESDNLRSDHDEETDKDSEDELMKQKIRKINKRKRHKETDPLSEVVQRREEQDTPKHQEDGDRLFLLSLLEPLQSVPQSKKMAVKIKMMSAIDEATQLDCETRQSIKRDFD